MDLIKTRKLLSEKRRDMKKFYDYFIIEAREKKLNKLKNLLRIGKSPL